MTNSRDLLRDSLQQIADQDVVEIALDPHWPIRIARAALAQSEPAAHVLLRGPTRMILCPTCGNKRCPHANNSAFACTGSNDPGQIGVASSGDAASVFQFREWSNKAV